jgi:hypothetical protein
MDTDGPNAACAATTDFGLRREAKRHAAFERNRSYGKRCRRCAPVFAALRLGKLPPQSKSLSSVREVAGLYYGLAGCVTPPQGLAGGAFFFNAELKLLFASS